jgi:gp16 family phage-associated protein
MNVPYRLPTRRPYTGEEVKDLFRAAGIHVSAWAEANGYTRREVYMLLNGQFKGRYGRMHTLALALGMKLPVERIAA